MREQWKMWEYYLISLGANIGFGCIWRFPFLIFKNGGGGFLFPFLLIAFGFIGPILQLLIARGQQSQTGIFYFYKSIDKRISGLALSKCLYSLMISSFYVYLLTYNFLFLYHVIFSDLDWMNVPQDKLLYSLSEFFNKYILMKENASMR